MTLDFQDFQKQDIKFNISELQKAYREIIKIKNFDGPEGISNFGAISLTQIPGNPDSCLLYTSPSPRDGLLSRMPSSA